MEKILSQQEIDALFQAAQNSASGGAPARLKQETRNYVVQTGAREVRVVWCSDFLGVRLGTHSFTELLFRIMGREAIPKARDA